MSTEEPHCGRYRHFKGGDYHVLFVASSSENRDERFVVYWSYTKKCHWIRPVKMWFEIVEWPDGVKRPRFVALNEGVPYDGG